MVWSVAVRRWRHRRGVWGRLLWGMVVVGAIGGLTAFALPVVGSLRGGSAQFQDPASGFERANALYRRAVGQQAYFGLDVLLRADAQAARSIPVGRVESIVESRLARQRGFERLTDAIPQGPRKRQETVVMAAFASPAASVAAAGMLRKLFSASRGRRIGGWSALIGGPDITFGELDARTSSVAEHVEMFAVIALLMLCLLVFRGWAAVLPLVVGATATLITFAALRLLNMLVPVSIYSLPAVLGLALGLSVDYSLLLLTRYRQERASDAKLHLAIQRMLQTAGRTVLLSAATIAVALAAALRVFPLAFLSSIGLAAAVTALAAGLSAWVLVPRLLLLLGGRVDRPPSLINRGVHSRARRGGWERVALWVTRHPLLVAGMSVLLLAVVAEPALGWRLVAPSAQLLPPSAESRQVEAALTRDFGSGDPAGVIYTIYKPTAHTPSVQTLARQQTHIAAGDAESLPSRYLGVGTWELSLLPHGAPDSRPNQQLLERLRANGAAAGAVIGGIAAFTVDQRTAIASRLPLALLTIALVGVAALWWLSGSVVIAIKGILMASLSVAAGIGVLIWACGALEIADLVFLATIAFALSTDYELFLVARIREEHDHGLTNQQAIAAGLAHTGPMITSAALLFCVAVGPFAFSSLFFAKEFGIGATAVVAIDASLIRMLLVPALMTLFGELNWWSPAPLRQLHQRIDLHQHQERGISTAHLPGGGL